MLSRSGRIVQLKQQFAADSAAHDALSAEATDAHSSGSGWRSVANSLETSSLQFHSTRLLASEDFLHDEIINEQFTRWCSYAGTHSFLEKMDCGRYTNPLWWLWGLGELGVMQRPCSCAVGLASCDWWTLTRSDGLECFCPNFLQCDQF
jgi:hypothetical protein